ncbi:ATP-binding protein [Vibrio sp. S4M6]|uniref:AAA family ATPase n=1 Tax=Vibrio sinus TaxID=2946865 RepID=UPI00202A1CAC|nr:ATP-binding protein [Vibrio sinus]MCL9783450.1 ATP-binding protein [Vibrio sinus]
MKGVGKLTFFCGKMGAGKTTKSQLLSQETSAVLISEDDWLTTLYPDQIKTFDDYLLYSARLKPLVRSHVQNILQTGTDVVLDYPANTAKQRKWFMELSSEVGAAHELMFLERTDEQCLTHIAKRRVEQPHRAQFDCEDVFHMVTQYFEPPIESENLTIVYCD